MTALRASGQPNIQFFPKKASTAMSAGAVVSIEGANGWFTLGTASTSIALGLLQESFASTDADYATVRPAMVDLLDSRDVIQMDVTGTLTTAMIGQYLKLSTSLVADAGTATSAQSPAAGLILMCVGFISATQGLFIVNGLQATRPAA